MTATIADMNPALERFIQQFKATSDAIIDSWFICDQERNIVDYNRAFFSLFPRPEARQQPQQMRRGQKQAGDHAQRPEHLGLSHAAPSPEQRVSSRPCTPIVAGT